MEVYSNENEQTDALRNFFANNGKALAIGVVIGIAKAPSTPKGGRCVQQEDLVTDVATAGIDHDYTETAW